LYSRVRERMPCIGWMKPGRTTKLARNGSSRSAFSVLPFTRAHITRPRSLLSAPLPDT
jgi:hypothetical protein